MARRKTTKTFDLGDRVTWSSQAGGHSKTKLGTIVEVVRAGKFPKHYSNSSTREHESYVVEVYVRKTEKLVTYWPLANKLSRVRKAKPKKRIVETVVASEPTIERGYSAGELQPQIDDDQTRHVDFGTPAVSVTTDSSPAYSATEETTVAPLTDTDKLQTGPYPKLVVVDLSEPDPETDARVVAALEEADDVAARAAVASVNGHDFDESSVETTDEGR